MFACNRLLSNHGSPIRGETFITRKISRAVARIAMYLQDQLYFGNLSAKRDWRHARDYVEAMRLMLNQPQPEDFVIATGTSTGARDFVHMAFVELGIRLELAGQGIDEAGLASGLGAAKLEQVIRRRSVYHQVGRELVIVDPAYFQPTEVDALMGEASEAREKLGWTPKLRIEALVAEMVARDVLFCKKEKQRNEVGHNIRGWQGG